MSAQDDAETVVIALRFVWSAVEKREAVHALAHLQTLAIEAETPSGLAALARVLDGERLLRRTLAQPDLLGSALAREIREYLGTHEAAYPTWDEPSHEDD